MSDVDILVWTLVGAAIFITVILVYVSQSTSRDEDDKKKAKKRPKEKPARVQDAGPVRARNRRRTAMDRIRRRAMQEEGEDDEYEDYDEEETEDPILQELVDQQSGKIGKKKMEKLEKKAQKREMREHELQEREERKERQAMLEELRKREEEKREQEEKRLEEEERLRKEEQERREHEEYLKMKEMFTVEDEGHEHVLTESESQSLLKEFIDYIKNKKVVILEELGAQFNLRTQEAINRVQDLQADGSLSGVMDDRGKFIYISEEEMQSVAKFIKQRGRVSISELADHSNMLINLQSNIEVAS
ncbi:uncharacterized protein LOC100370458 isoform X2 [Saccoglossus kowalevskii]|uniref:DDRGK domain-containing protein 1 n=1 Tax=Saccoglossus kowalevskii TaxID=10224 RepID=A0ABM0M8S1_SACKO|nr:PREDICTED: DDRGK domain-containing protein 1-like isoform X2 [Saccoglossus kowalevskii]